MKFKEKILLHSCCSICSGHPIQYLRKLGYEPISYFFNPNIYPVAEYQKRLDSQRKLCKTLNCELIVDNYDPELYNEIMKEFKDYPEGSQRCKRCFELRLLRTAQKTKELGIKHYTTSISISPHKNFNVIKEVGKSFEDYFNINFIDIDFKKQDGFMKTNLIAKSLDLYRQNYCGCNISMQKENSNKG